MTTSSIFRFTTLSVCLFSAMNAWAGVDGYASLNGGTTGGEGGDVVYATTGTEINQAMCNRSSDDTPLTIYVTGTINHDNTEQASGSCNTRGDAIQFKGVSNISLIGQGEALFDEIGIHIRDASNIIIRNVHVRNVKKSGSPISNGGDAIGLEKNVHNIWIDHNELEASGGEKDGYDSLIDMKATTQYVTVSYNYLHHSGRGGLIGSSDNDTENTYITFHHNRYENIDSRLPLLRHGTVHAFNNYYAHVSKSGMNPRIGGQIKAENNVFNDVQNPIGTFYTDDMGYWDLSGNQFNDVTWLDNSTNHPAGPDPVSTTSITIPYQYTLDETDCVQSIVLATAGTQNDYAVSDGKCATSTRTEESNETADDTSSSNSDTSDSSSDTSSSDDSASIDVSGETNLSIGAGSDGDGKGMGSYGSVRDGDSTTLWAPKGSTGTVSIKWKTAQTINAVVIREADDYSGNITSWQLTNNDTDEVIASGTSTGVITFDAVSLKKVNFTILSSKGTPTVAEFETYFIQ
ncbi:pectate lyase family protein [Vibrio nitrifigilis]|uniref:Pectate lyase n=1 Tax=Vibrio nitrifigilis TaxID=2789781 RepID=A0ABS0GFU5_9VIBR|nr:pectate lyase [Vibrio nitrifigilis]MBF9001118.1 pectate lyase [Vibrio nitrifigilis]